MLFSKIYSISAVNLWDKILNWYRNSLIKELLDYLETQVFSITFGDYDNITLSERSGENIKNILIGLILGTILASAAAYYMRAVQGKFVRELLKKECFSPDTAVTLRECGFFCNPSVRRELSKGGALSKITKCTDAVSEEHPIDFLTARFYIPEDDKYRAEFRYTKKGASVPHLLLTVGVCILVGVLLFRWLPQLLSFADWIVGGFN